MSKVDDEQVLATVTKMQGFELAVAVATGAVPSPENSWASKETLDAAVVTVLHLTCGGAGF